MVSRGATTTVNSSPSKRSTDPNKSSNKSSTKRQSKQSSDSSSKVQESHDEEDEDEDEGDEDEYEVEAIVAHKKTKKGSLIFLLKWKNYPDSENTWESQEDLNCYELVEQYLKENNIDRKGNPIKSNSSSSSRKRSSTVPAAQSAPSRKKAKASSSPSKSSSPSSDNKKRHNMEDLDEFLNEPVRKLDPEMESWENELFIETIGLADEDGGHEPTPGDRDKLTVYGLDKDGNRLCEFLKDVRIKAPQRLLDFLLDHLKFRS